MKKRILILAIVCAAIITAFAHYGYFEYILDSGKIDRSNNKDSVVVTLSIGPDALIIKPYDKIIQIKSDKTITENRFRIISRYNNPFRFMPIYRSYDDKIIKGRTRTLSNNDYDTLIDILRNSNFKSIQSEIDNADGWVDGNSTYITVVSDNGLDIVGGHCAECKDERFKSIMDYILGLLE